MHRAKRMFATFLALGLVSACGGGGGSGGGGAPGGSGDPTGANSGTGGGTGTGGAPRLLPFATSRDPDFRDSLQLLDSADFSRVIDVAEGHIEGEMVVDLSRYDPATRTVAGPTPM